AGMLHMVATPAGHHTLLKGETSESHGHRHEVTIDSSGGWNVASAQGHTHELQITGSGDTAKYTLGPPEGQLQAPVPIYAKCPRFRDPTGKPGKGGNVGDEWMYRQFIAGQTAAAAIWDFQNVTPAEFPEDKFPSGIPVEMTIEVFRTHKGDMTRGVLG